MKYCTLLFYISYPKKKKKKLYIGPKDKFLALPLLPEDLNPNSHNLGHCGRLNTHCSYYMWTWCMQN